MNPQIEEARQVALAILKPTKRELEHGQELHRDAVVIDAYGFAPRTAIDNDKIERLIAEGASPREIQDRKEEMISAGFLDKEPVLAEYKEAWEASGVTCLLQCAGEEGNDVERLIRRLGYFTHIVDRLRDFYRRAVFAEDIEAAKAEGRHALCLSVNGVPVSRGACNAHDMLSHVRVFYQLGCRMMHLTYNRRNLLGDGCGEGADGGLSDFGRMAIQELNRVGIIPDVAHSGQRTSLEAAEASSKPVVASHSFCRRLQDHYRGKDDEVIDAIAGSGGFVGICHFTLNLRAMLDHIDHVVEQVGVDHVAIGTDLAYYTAAYEDRFKPACRDAFEQLWPPAELRNTRPNLPPKSGLSLKWTNWPLFTVGLVQRGYSDEDVRKIIGGNVLRVLRDTCGTSA